MGVEIPFILKRITKEPIKVLWRSNHEEADAKLNFHAEISNEEAVIAANNADVFYF